MNFFFFPFFLILILLLKIISRFFFIIFCKNHYLKIHQIKNPHVFIDIKNVFLDFQYFFNLKNSSWEIKFVKKKKHLFNFLNYKKKLLFINKEVLGNFDVFKLNYCLSLFYLSAFALKNKNLYLRFKLFYYCFLFLNYFLNLFLLINIFLIFLIDNHLIIKIFNFTSVFLILTDLLLFVFLCKVKKYLLHHYKMFMNDFICQYFGHYLINLNQIYYWQNLNPFLVMLLFIKNKNIFLEPFCVFN